LKGDLARPVKGRKGIPKQPKQVEGNHKGRKKGSLNKKERRDRRNGKQTVGAKTAETGRGRN